MTHKDMTARLREALKTEGIKARVSMMTACKTRYIRVITPEYGAWFKPSEILRLATIAKDMGLTGAQGSPIDPALEVQLFKKDQWSFEFHG